jgi:hypothetical protein
MAKPETPAQRADRYVRNRQVLIWTHTGLAYVTLFLYVSRFDLVRFRYWAPRAGQALLIVAGPALIPYLVSVVRALQFVTHRRAPVARFVGVVVGGFLGASAAFMGAFGHIDTEYLFCVFAVQAAIYYCAADLILDDE